MKGKLLKIAINNSGIPIKELVRKTGIPERRIYSLYDRPVVKQIYLDKLKEAGVDLQKTTVHKAEETASPEFYERVLKSFEASIQMAQELTESHKTYRKIVEQAVEAGAIVPDKTKKITAKLPG